MSRATTVTVSEAPAFPDAKKGRAKARASSTSVAMRSASSNNSRRCRFSVCSTGACFKSLTAANFTRGSGSRFNRCSTSGMATAAAPARNTGERNDNIYSARDLVERYDSNASSSGCVVFSS